MRKKMWPLSSKGVGKALVDRATKNKNFAASLSQKIEKKNMCFRHISLAMPYNKTF